MSKVPPPKTNISQLPFDTGRVDFSGHSHFLGVDDLIGHQTESFRWFVEEGLPELFGEMGPIEEEVTHNKPGGGQQRREKFKLEFKKLEFAKLQRTDLEARRDKLNYEALLKAEVRLTRSSRGVAQTSTIYMGNYPWMTNRGTFILNGSERIIISQISRSPGVFFSVTSLSRGRCHYGAKIAPYRGAWLEISTSKDGDMSVKIDRRRRVSLTSFLVALGLTPDQIRKATSEVDTGPINYIEQTLAKDGNFSHNLESYADSARLEVYNRLRPGDSINVKNALEVLENRFYNPKQYDMSPAGRHKLNQRLGLKTPNDLVGRQLGLDDMLATVVEIIRLNNNGDPPDDIDSLGNRRLRLVGELIRNQFRIGLLRMERNIRERMQTCEPESVSAGSLINARPIIGSVRTFFASSQLSQYMDQVNPLSELAHKRRLSSMGPGGLNRDRAGPQVRDAHPTHYGRICPVETPEGPSIGLVLNMALYAKIDRYGFMLTPYRVIDRELPAASLAGHIARRDLVDELGKVIVPGGQKIGPAAAKKLAVGGRDKLFAVKPRLSDKVVYLTADEERKTCIFSHQNEVNDDGYFVRDYGSARQGLNIGQFPVTEATHIDASRRQIVGSSAGLTPLIEKNYLTRALYAANQSRQAVPLIKPRPPIVGTGLESVIARNTGQVVYAEDDGQVVSATAERLIVKYAKQKTKQTYQLIHYLRSNNDTAINQRVVVNVGDKFQAGQPLIEGTSISEGELALGRDLLAAVMFWDGDNFEDAVVISDRLVREDVLTSVNITEHLLEVRDTKLGPETVTRDIPNVSEHSLRNLDEGGIVRIGAEVAAGDILVGKITPKGEQELSSEERLLRAIFGEKAKDIRDSSRRLPNGKEGKVVDVRIFSKDNDHELKAGVLQQIQVYVAQCRKVQVGDKLAGRYGNKGVIARILPAEDMPFTADGRPVDLILNPIGIAGRMNLGQLFECHLSLAAKKLGLKVSSPPLDGISNEKIVELLEKAGLPADGKQQLYDGRTGQPFSERTSVGYMYFYKLNHMVADKVHVRNTGPYAIVTKQPLGGKAQNGGQRFGEMEVWALEAYGAATTLQEMLTIKSDDLIGRARAHEAIIRQNEILAPKIPESFNVLVKELQALGLKIDLIDSQAGQSADAEVVISDHTRSETSVQVVASTGPGQVASIESSPGPVVDQTVNGSGGGGNDKLVDQAKVDNLDNLDNNSDNSDDNTNDEAEGLPAADLAEDKTAPGKDD